MNLCNLYARLARDDCTDMDPLFSVECVLLNPGVPNHKLLIVPGLRNGETRRVVRRHFFGVRARTKKNVRTPPLI